MARLEHPVGPLVFRDRVQNLQEGHHVDLPFLTLAICLVARSHSGAHYTTGFVGQYSMALELTSFVEHTPSTLCVRD